MLFKRFVAPSLLERVRPMIEAVEERQYFSKEDPGKERIIAREMMLKYTHPLSQMFLILVNQPRLFEAIGKFAGLHKTIRFFDGRFYKLVPDSDCFDSWHSDNGPKKERLCGMSINLSPEPFTGGKFEIRDRRDKETVTTIAESQFGDAHLFRIAPGLEHRVTPLQGTAPRQVYAGWFMSKPVFRNPMQRRADIRESLSADACTPPISRSCDGVVG